MADFQSPNYGFLNGLADGANGFLNAYMTVKNINHQQKMQEMATGVTQDENGNYKYADWKQAELDQKKSEAGLLQKQADTKTKIHTLGTPEEQSERQMDEQMAQSVPGMSGFKIPQGTSAGDWEDSPNFGLMKSKIEAQAGMNRLMPLVDQREQQMAFQQHETAQKAVVGDSQTKKMLDGKQSIENALVEFSKNPSNQSFEGLQSMLRQNLGSANKSGVAERAAQYAQSTQLKATDLAQLITGHMQNVNLSDPDMVDAIKLVAQGELENKQKQAGKQIDKTAGMYTAAYQNPKNPYMQGYKQNFDDTVQKQKDQFNFQKVIDEDSYKYAHMHNIPYADAEKLVNLRRNKQAAAQNGR